MFVLLLTMLERLGIIVTIAFILTRFRFFRAMIYERELKKKQQYIAILFFGFFGIIGTYSGVTFNADSLDFNRWASGLTHDEAIANSRVIGVVIAGLLGGYKVGIGAGLIAGIHRFTLGGFTAAACGLATILAGIIAGAFHKEHRQIKLTNAFFIGAGAEMVQMIIILFLADPFLKALNLVEMIGIPMIFANGIGSALFLLVIKNVVSEEEKAGALQAQVTLRIANKTIPFLRKGLNGESAEAVCSILIEEMKACAVSITNQERILAHIGKGRDHHCPDEPIQTQITRQVLETGEMIVANEKSIDCVKKDCPLNAAVIAPLRQRGKTAGTLKIYFQSEKEINNISIELISGLSSLLSNQLEMAEAEHAFQLAKEAEIKALQAQIHPHFLFNTMNTIVSLIRVDADKARKLLVSFSNFIRQNLHGTTETTTTIGNELDHVKAYLSIVETRFVDKIQIEYQIDEKALTVKIPPLTLQPLVENACQHGFRDKQEQWNLEISVQTVSEGTIVGVKDNGYGIEEKMLERMGKELMASESGSGLALYNINRRLSILYGPKSTLKIQSKIGEGTMVSFFIPSREEG
ncbi:sensor histidine kinase [Falsibacillus pallidus]|uniref:histidine kinase n=1 Tax=Falsibacillus pallidus TaxID=493781 RepID=A0A370GQ15_9BACI|nr:sensor histidine kinase [Falsibacillus pallidus]RDI45400.1 two-component system sensor histidine kinase LytS [Falsibacillus pallidus]